MLIEMLTENKGGNPGGYCKIGREKFYLKYCHGSRVRNRMPFDYNNQPIYEVVALELARNLGLVVPVGYVVENNENLKFAHSRNIRTQRRINENRPRYFLSKISNFTDSMDEESANKIMDDEKTHRDLLIVGDVEKKRQNYRPILTTEGANLEYLDLGCSFTDAVEGRMGYRSMVSKVINQIYGKGVRPKTLIRNSLKKIDGLNIVSAHVSPYTQRFINLEGYCRVSDYVQIPRIGGGRTPIASMLSAQEVESIENLLIVNAANIVRREKNNDHSPIL